LGDLDTDERIALKWILKKYYEDVDLVHLANTESKRKALVNTLMNLLVL